VTGYMQYQDSVPRTRHRLRTTIIVLIILIGLLVALDFGARAFAESKVASEIQQQGFPKKPNVSIEGFPFLTQVVSRDFKDVQISSSNITEGPLLIQSIDATMNGVHVNSSFNGGSVDSLNGTLSVTFAALANAMTSQAGSALGSLGGAGLTLSQAGNDEVKATLNLVITSGTAVWRVTRTDNGDISIQLVSSTGLTSSLLSGLGNITIPLPHLPLGLTIQNISVTSSGLVGTVTGHDVSFGG
jgi:LmeA-like phospholipid-binding